MGNKHVKNGSETNLLSTDLLSKQIEEINGRSNYKIMEDIFESFVGALYIDSNDINIVELWIINIIEKYIDFVALCRANGIHVPIVPGLKAITGKKQLINLLIIYLII